MASAGFSSRPCFVCLPEGRSIHISILSMSAISCCIPITITRGYIGVPVSFCRVLTPQGRVHDLRLLLPGNITCISISILSQYYPIIIPITSGYILRWCCRCSWCVCWCFWPLASGREPGNWPKHVLENALFFFFSHENLHFLMIFPCIPPFVDDFPS